ncbi:hypothetical protein OAT10_00120 [Luminiphilus sp.]|nr:hypothetical protein [Luminiphilus sp.]
MVWKRKINRRYPKRNWTKIKNYSISRKLKEEGLINTEFEVRLASLPLEDIIALKLDLTSETLGGYFYGIPFWKIIPFIIKEAVLKYAMTACYSKKDVGRFLGIREKELFMLLKKYKIEEYFGESE